MNRSAVFSIEALCTAINPTDNFAGLVCISIWIWIAIAPYYTLMTILTHNEF